MVEKTEVDFFQDIPFSCPGISERIVNIFPQSKYILTVREDVKKWVESVKNFWHPFFNDNKFTLARVAIGTTGFAFLTSSVGTPASVKISFNKASYAPGETGYIRITPLDPAGKALPAAAFEIPRAAYGQISDDNKYIAYTPITSWDAEWRNYRGGQAMPIWIVDLKTKETKPLTTGNYYINSVAHTDEKNENIYFAKSGDS